LGLFLPGTALNGGAATENGLAFVAMKTLEKRSRSQDTTTKSRRWNKEVAKSMRVGIGYDVHRLVDGRKMILGGVAIAHEKGLLGHSDADVLAHAVCDALLGAAGLGDIGGLFPDHDPRYKDVDSLNLLAEALAMVRQNGWRVNNVDATVIAEQPRLAPHIGTMRANIAAALAVDAQAVNIKATTTEGLGFAGRKEGIAAMSVVSLIAIS